MAKMPPTQKDRLLQLALDCQSAFAGWIDPAGIPFAPELREMCTQNSCGQYGTSWMGPPAIGPVEDLMENVRTFSDGLVIQTVHQLEDSFDYPGMMEARAEHQNVFFNVLAAIRNELPTGTTLLALDAGCCHLCGDCAYPDELCRRPGEAISSIEAYGIVVNRMLEACGLQYNNGQNTVSYVGLILFKEPC